MGVLDMNEDFVSFSLAMKLKEKGFDVPCIYAYCEKGGWNMYKQEHEPITHVLRTDGNPFGSFYCGKNWNVKYETNKNKIRCSAPPISQVLKWLREEKKMHIRLSVYFIGWCYDIIMTEGEYNHLHGSECEYYSYEEAELAGIEYCLDNLI